MQTASSSETSVSCTSTRCHNPQDCDLYLVKIERERLGKALTLKTELESFLLNESAV